VNGQKKEVKFMEKKEAPVPLARYHLEPQTGKAFSVQQNQRVRVIDAEGEQVADLTCFARRDTAQYLSSGRTIDYNEKIYQTAGDTLYSNLGNPMLTIIDDPVGKHDFLYAPCSRAMFRRTYGIEDPHPNCLDNLADSLAPFGISASRIPTAFNIFMNTVISGEGAIAVKTPLSRAGDYIELQARMDLIIAVTACAAGRCNNFRCTSVDIEVYAGRE
jgi:uncharacterized protein YcgI (DUF1989 family)